MSPPQRDSSADDQDGKVVYAAEDITSHFFHLNHSRKKGGQSAIVLKWTIGFVEQQNAHVQNRQSCHSTRLRSLAYMVAQEAV